MYMQDKKRDTWQNIKLCCNFLKYVTLLSLRTKSKISYKPSANKSTKFPFPAQFPRNLTLKHGLRTHDG